MTKPRPRLAILPDASVGMRRWLVCWREQSLVLSPSHAQQLAGDDLARARDDVVAHWAKRHPGTRPRLWWRWDAPSPRLRLGGKGEPLVYEKTPATMNMISAFREFGTSTNPICLLTSRSLRIFNNSTLFFPGEKRRVKRRDYLPVIVRGSYDDPKTYWRATVLE